MKNSLIDVNFDFTTDTPRYWNGYWEKDNLLGTPNGDPDSASKTMQLYHKLLYSKPLPILTKTKEIREEINHTQQQRESPARTGRGSKVFANGEDTHVLRLKSELFDLRTEYVNLRTSRVPGAKFKSAYPTTKMTTRKEWSG